MLVCLESYNLIVTVFVVLIKAKEVNRWILFNLPIPETKSLRRCKLIPIKEPRNWNAKRMLMNLGQRKNNC
ncbi:hypothetical protein Patl1_27134 [Pistacia atlantica]|uniref:Uncharacterized protein n=1 Tax=Pistacia atlantica TaxID=434234 RepID=A0ACC1B2Y4_9ROSI|nr:hypothetical protein Patl1_27134 [Pistacia atlantica]